MRTVRFSLVVSLLVFAFSSIANAQATRTWVSGVGDDANPCSRTAPCKTFAGAISKTATGGEIDCLDPGGFGAVTITKSITIDCDSGPGGVLSTLGSNGVIINGAGAVVTLRSVNVFGAGSGGTGVSIITAATVHLVDMNISGWVTAGVTANVGANLVLTVEDTRIHDCGGGSGIRTNATAGILVTADYNRVSIWNVGTGVNAQNGSRVQLHNSTIVATSFGVDQNTLNGTGSVVTVFNSAFTGNGTALRSIAGASIGASSNVFSTNSLVYNTNGGIISTANDNVPNGNAANGATNGVITKI